MKGAKAMDALPVFPGSKVERAGMPVKRACLPISRDDPRYQTLIPPLR